MLVMRPLTVVILGMDWVMRTLMLRVRMWQSGSHGKVGRNWKEIMVGDVHCCGVVEKSEIW